MASKDFYEVLGVDRTASADEIRRTYRRLARESHPDRNPGDSKAEERFKEVTRAYEVLGDAGKREVYDELGMEAQAIDFDPERAKTYRQWAEQQARGPRPGSGFGGGKGQGQPDLGDLFGDLFGGGGGFPGFGGFGGFSDVGARGPGPGADVRTQMQIDFREAVLGGERRISLERPGAPVSCSRCGGTGRLTARQGGIQLQLPCDTCAGDGATPGPSERATLDVRIPPGIEDGQTIRLKGQGAPGPRGGPSGDLLIKVRVSDHPKLRRDGRDLHLDVPVTLREALLGGNIEIPTLDGKKVRLRVPPGVRPGQRLRIGGKGVAASKGEPAGDLYVHLFVALPTDASPDDPELRHAVEAIERRYQTPVRSELEEI